MLINKYFEWDYKAPCWVFLQKHYEHKNWGEIKYNNDLTIMHFASESHQRNALRFS